MILLLFTAFRQKEENRAEASKEAQGHPKLLIFLGRYEGEQRRQSNFLTKKDMNFSTLKTKLCYSTERAAKAIVGAFQRARSGPDALPVPLPPSQLYSSNRVTSYPFSGLKHPPRSKRESFYK